MTLVYLAYFIFFGATLSSGILEGLKEREYSDDYYFEEYDDSLDVRDIEELLPPVYQDTTGFDSIAPLEE